MKKESIFLIIIILCVTIMVIYNQVETSIKIDASEVQPIRWNAIERDYLGNLSEIRLGVPEDLLYLLNQEGEDPYKQGFLYDYLAQIFQPTGKTLTLVPIPSSILGVKSEDIGEVDCMVSEVTKPLRLQSDHISFTAPIFKTKGSLFVRSDFLNKENSGAPLANPTLYMGLALKKDLETENIQDIKYNNTNIEFTSQRDLESMIDRGVREGWDFIAGNQQEITLALLKNGKESLYLDQGIGIYNRNVCIIIEKDKSVLYSIIESLLNEQDLKAILTQLQGKWYGLPTSFVDESPFMELFLVIIIIFAGVLAVFFIYYNSNKNLYQELRTRMEELVSSQNEMRTTFNGVSYLMAELDIRGTVLDINKAFLEFLEERRQNLIGKSFMDIWNISSTSKEKIAEAIEESSIGRTSRNLELTEDNHIFEIGVFPVSNPRNQLEKILFIANDVTSIRAAKRQIIQDNKMIAVGQLAAGVAHEIRNPLGIIRNYCYLLKTMDPNDSEKRSSALQVIEKSVETSSNIINNLLNFSRISTSDKETVWLKDHFDSLLFLHELKTLESGITIDIECQEDFQVQILKESFNMILVNLISNAIDASQEGGEIKITLRKRKESFIVSVKDSGSGIPQKDMDNIFNPFFTTKTKKKGNGLGLYIVYNEVNKMNGTINLTSQEGYGTEFYLEFPLESQEGSRTID